MARIGILTCSNATQDLGCASASCLADLRKRRGAFADYPADQPIDLVGIINCPGCPTLAGPEKLLRRIESLTAFRVDAIHFTFCVKALCPFREQYRRAAEQAHPQVRVVMGTHQEHVSALTFRGEVGELLCQPRQGMADLILGRKDP